MNHVRTEIRTCLAAADALFDAGMFAKAEKMYVLAYETSKVHGHAEDQQLTRSNLIGFFKRCMTVSQAQPIPCEPTT